MVADDLLLSATSHEDLKCMLSSAESDANKERYKFNETKTKIVSTSAESDCVLLLNGKALDHSKGEPHLGIVRNSKGSNTDTILKRVQDARRSLYSILGAGFTGLNGVGPEISLIAYKTYIIPVLLYGTEALVLQDKDIAEISKFHKMVLRRFQHFPDSTALPALFLMSGCPPIEALTHIRVICLLRNILIADEDSPPAKFMSQLILRQMATKEFGGNSWAKYAQSILEKYGLHTSDILLQTPSKLIWKKKIKDLVLKHWTEKLKEQAMEKSSLIYLDCDNCNLREPSTVWMNLETPLDVRKATIKAKLQISRYPLGSSHQGGRRDVCQLCNKDTEDITLFLLHCKETSQARRPYITRILEICRSAAESIDPENITRLIMQGYPQDVLKKDFETLTRNMIFKIHNRRAILLGGGNLSTE